MNDLIKIKRVLKVNLCILLTVLKVLYDIEVKNQVKALPSFKEMDNKLDSMTLMKAFKNIVYTGRRDNRHAKHNKATVHINFMRLYQEQFQDIQDFHDQ